MHTQTSNIQEIGIKPENLDTFFMAWHLAVSEKPIILSGEQILMKGKLDSSAIFAAKAVFPLWGGPAWRYEQGREKSQPKQRGVKQV